METTPKPFPIHASLFTVGAIYAANFTIGKMAVPAFVQPFGMIFIRVFFGGLLFWVFTALFGKSEKIQSLKDYGHLILCSIVGVAFNQLMFFKGLSITTPINASLIMAATPILVLIASAFILKERITFLKTAGILLGTSGALLLIGGEGFAFRSDTLLGDLAIFVNALSYGVYLVIVKPLTKKYSALTITKWVFAFGLIFVTPFGFGEFLAVDWAKMPSEIWLCTVYIVVFTTFFAYLLNAWALQYCSPNLVGIYIYVQPILAIAIAIVFRGDELTVATALYSLMIFAGVYLVSMKRG